MGERTALYRVYDGDDMLLYVGVSKSFGSRWAQHEKTQPWWPLARRQVVTWYDSREEALIMEAAAIKAEHPRFNVTHNGVLPPPIQTLKRSRTLLLTMDEAGRELRLSTAAVRAMIADGTLESVKIRNKFRIPYDVLEKYVSGLRAS